MSEIDSKSKSSDHAVHNFHDASPVKFRSSFQPSALSIISEHVKRLIAVSCDFLESTSWYNKECSISFESLKIDNKLKIICYIDEIEIANVIKLTPKPVELQNNDSKLMEHSL